MLRLCNMFICYFMLVFLSPSCQSMLGGPKAAHFLDSPHFLSFIIIDKDKGLGGLLVNPSFFKLLKSVACLTENVV